MTWGASRTNFRRETWDGVFEAYGRDDLNFLVLELNRNRIGGRTGGK